MLLFFGSSTTETETPSILYKYFLLFSRSEPFKCHNLHEDTLVVYCIGNPFHKFMVLQNKIEYGIVHILVILFWFYFSYMAVKDIRTYYEEFYQNSTKY